MYTYCESKLTLSLFELLRLLIGLNITRSHVESVLRRLARAGFGTN